MPILDVLSGSAARVGALCRECGLTITKVGATFPYGKDPNDRNIRIAPTFPPVKELETAALILCISVKIACLEEVGYRLGFLTKEDLQNQHQNYNRKEFTKSEPVCFYTNYFKKFSF